MDRRLRSIDYPGMLSAKRFTIAVCCVALSIVGCGKKEAENKNTPRKSQPKITKTPGKAKPGTFKRNAPWDKFVRGYIEQTLRANPNRGVGAGRHEFDGKIPDQSKTGIKREESRLRAALGFAKAFKVKQLSPEQVFERQYMMARITGDLFWYESKHYERVPLFYAWPINPSIYITRKYAPLSTRMNAMLTLQSNIPTVVTNAKANLKTPMPKTYVKTALGIFGGYAKFFKDVVPKVFASVKGDDLHKRFAAANKKAVAALEDMAKWLGEQMKTATDKYALGADMFSQMLAKTEGVNTPLAELQKIGEADLARNLKSLADACAKIAAKQPIKKCIEIVQSDKPKGGPVARAKEQLGEIEAFLRKADIVSIPGPDRATVAEAPPYNRWNFAYINIPGLWEKKGMPAVYYIAPPNPKWTAAERKAYLPGEADLMFVSVHEVWPGHFLNYLHAKQARSMFGRLFVGYAFSEGWAHYTEEMMWNIGLHKGDPKMHVGQLLNALLRNVRFLSAIGLHTQGMTVAQSEKMFLEKAFQDPGNAKQQAARGTFDPGYLNYTMGKLMIRKLRTDWCKTRGERKCWKAFHDKFLSFGGPPIPLVRKAMLGAKDDGKLF